MTRFLLALTSVWLGGLAGAAAAAPRTPVALNLGAWNYYQADLPTLDLMKKASPWITQCRACKDLPAGATAWDTKEAAQLDLDENGWVRSLPTGQAPQRFREVATLITANGYQPAGEYIVRYQGKGTIEYNGAGRKVAERSRPGRDVVRVDNQDTSAFWLTLTQIDRQTPLHDIQIFAPGGVCSLAPGRAVDDPNSCTGSGNKFLSNEELAERQVFSPGLLTDLKGFRALRFMDWGNTNASTLASWDKRPRLAHRTWAGPDGVPVEAMLEVARLSDSDPWINLPTRADLRYATQLGLLAKERLAPGHRLILEYTNEAWNTAFPAASWLLDEGRRSWPEAAGRAGSQDLLRHNAYAMRSVQFCQAAKAAAGADKVLCVLNTQGAVPQQIEAVLACELARASLQLPHCGRGVDAVAIAPYFGYTVGSRERRAEVNEWMGRPDGGLGALFKDIQGGDGDKAPPGRPGSALAMAKLWMTDAKRVADRYGVALWAYEGGHHLATFPGDQDTRFFGLMKAATRSPQMVRAYARMIDDWQRVGGQVFAYYKHAGMPAPWGAFGLKETYLDDASPLWREVTRQRDQLTCGWPGC